MATATEPLRAILDTLPADVRGEIIEGQLVVTPRPTNRHQLIVARLIVQFARAQDCIALPEPELRLGGDVLVPDVAVWLRDFPADYATEPPEVVVEVLSPSTRRYDREQKVARYAALGVPHVWLVDADERAIDSFSAGAGSIRATGSGALPPFRALRIDVDALFL